MSRLKLLMESKLGTIDNLVFDVSVREFEDDMGYPPDVRMNDKDKDYFADIIMEMRKKIILPSYEGVVIHA